jgi:RNA polymerase sigma factor (TIGR02999 family)
MAEPEDITRLLLDLGTDDDAPERLYAAVYRDLRSIAGRQMGGERADHTLQPTALVHEAYLRLVDQTRVVWRNRAHFFAIAARAIRRILVDHARKRNAEKRGSGVAHVDVDDVAEIVGGDRPTDLVALDAALEKLAETDETKARVVELRFFGGLTAAETAEVLGTSQRSVERHWQFARAWLYRELAGADGD